MKLGAVMMLLIPTFLRIDDASNKILSCETHLSLSESYPIKIIAQISRKILCLYV